MEVNLCNLFFRVKQVDGIMLDLGMSATQLDTPKRGFSFRYHTNSFLLFFHSYCINRKTHDGPLDMRMNTDGEDLTASEVVNNLSAEQLTDIIEMVFTLYFCYVIVAIMS